MRVGRKSPSLDILFNSLEPEFNCVLPFTMTCQRLIRITFIASSFLLVTSQDTLAQGQVDDALESLALTDIYNQTYGDGWRNRWPLTSCCSTIYPMGFIATWHGVTVENGDIVGLNLSTNRLDGSIPPSIQNLSQLKVLNLRGNSIDNIPVELGSIAGLEELHLPFMTSLPDLGSLDNLKKLIIHMNGLPSWIGGLQRLEYLDVYGKMSTLPTSIGNLNSLKELYLKRNDLITLPSSVKNLSSLKILDLSNNDITSLPDDVFQGLISLEKLILDGNELETLPTSIGNMISLRQFHYDQGTLRSFPTTIDGLTNLEYLGVSSPLLKNLPSEINQLSSLKSMSITYALESLPEDFGEGNLSNLEILYLRGCKLIALPNSINNLPSLQRLILENNLIESLPSDIGNGNMNSLEYLNLRGNQLTELPSSIEGLLSLEELDLHYNKLTALPSSINGLSSLKKLVISVNSLGSLPDDFGNGNLNNLEYLDLSGNQLTELPSSIKNLSALKQLVVQGGILRSIPDDIGDGDLNSLEKIYFDSNELATIPPSIVNIPMLSRLSAESNKLRSFPSFKQHPNASNMSVFLRENYLDFSSIENNFISQSVNNFDVFLYNPQLEFAEPKPIPCGQSTVINDRSGGQYTNYQWFGSYGSEYTEISGATSMDLNLIGDYTYSKYKCRMTNSWVPGLEIYSSVYEVISEEEGEGFIADLIEISALRALYESTGTYNPGEGWTNKWPVNSPSDWDNITSLDQVKDWYGIITECRDITGLILQDNNLVGSLPEEIGDLQALTDLALRDNAIEVIPGSIGALSSLTSFAIERNALTALPPEIRNLTSLTRLTASANSLTAIPDFTGMSLLEYLDLSNNDLTSPPDVSGTSLWYLRLSYNELTSFPASGGALPTMLYIFADHNRIADASSIDLSGPSLQEAFLQNNELASFPDLSGRPFLPNSSLFLQNNYLTFTHLEPNDGVFENFHYSPQKDPGGVISLDCDHRNIINDRAGGNYTRYQWQGDFGDNQWELLGPMLPTANLVIQDYYRYSRYRCSMTNTRIDGLTIYSSIFEAYMEEGDVSDALEIAALKALYESTGNLNEATGEYYTDNSGGWTRKWPVSNPADWEGLSVRYMEDWNGFSVRCGDITSLGPNYNNLVGDIPPELGNLLALESLSFRGNSITSLPDELGNLTLLRLLDVGYNSLTGLPETINGLSSLQQVYAGHNSIENLPISIGDLTGLERLYLPHNLITELPNTINGLTSVRTLYLNYNELSCLPDNIGGLSAVETLVLSYNQLSSLPESIGDLTSLNSVYLNYNNLTDLPASFINLPASTVRLAYNLLTQLPFDIGRIPNLYTLTLQGNLLRELPNDIVNLSTLSFLNVSNNLLREFPNFRGHPNESNLAIYNLDNYLDFLSIEQNFKGVMDHPFGIFNYAPQRNPENSICLSYDQDLIVNDRSGGLYTRYQWLGSADGTQWTPIAGATDPDLHSPSGYGYVYFKCEMTNDWVTGMTLYSSVFYYPSEQIAISPPGPLSLCPPQTQSLSASAGFTSYQWYLDGVPLATGSAITAQQGGQYTVSAANAEGCTFISEPVTINAYSVPVISLSSLPATCSESLDGEVVITVTGGSGGYTFQIRGPDNSLLESGNLTDGVSLTVSTLPTGNHRLIVTDQISPCSPVQRNFTINNGGPTIAICAFNPVCSAQPDGSINSELTVMVNRSRGNPGESYNYEILDGANTVLASGSGLFGQELAPKPVVPYTGEAYRFVVQSGTYNPCLATERNIAITPASLSVSLDQADAVYEKCAINQQVDVILSPSLNQTTCSSLTVVSYDVEVEKDGAAYQSFSGQVAPVTLADLPSGNYSVTLTGSVGATGTCMATIPFQVSEAFLLAEVTVTDPTCSSPADDGMASARVTGGAGPYRYYWYQGSTLLSSLSTVTSLSPGTYRLELWGQHCVVPYIEEFDIVAPSSVGDVTITLPVSNCDLSATLSNIGGLAPYDFYWIQQQEVERTVLAFNPASNTFDETVITDVVENVVFVDQDVEPSGGTAVSQTTTDVVETGNYIVRVVDANGCGVESANTHIEQPQFTRSYDLCFRWKTPAIAVPDEPQNQVVVNSTSIEAVNMGKLVEEETEACISNQVASFGSALRTYCYSLDYLQDEVTISYDLSTYHHTLYYYDRVGNLVRTVPPKGVNRLSGAFLSRDNTPAHGLVTSYDYNSLGQLVHQQTPDAGAIRFAYNDLGQLRFSQNAEQAIPGNNQFSYTKYDELGRIVEVGQSDLGIAYQEPGGGTFPTNSFNDLESTALLDLDKKSYQELPVTARFPTAAQGLSEQTLTTYSDPFAPINYNGEGQTYLRNRVSKTTAMSTEGEEVSTYFSYDPHGNVEWLIQDIAGLGTSQIGYDYDLISGNVLQVKYNESQEDQFFHRYQYDEDNRIKTVSTSTDGLVWEQDATYQYYDHGPLSKVLLGDTRVQEIDYAYTLHGWLKAINDPSGNPEQGSSGKDAFGMTLGYYQGDFTRPGSPFNSHGSNASNLPALTGYDLYNGNISSWQLGTHASDDSWMRTGFQYTYDKLNRIRASNFSVNREGNFYGRGGFMADFAFDPNGNLQTLNRNDIDDEQMDVLRYHLRAASNQLDHVDDLSTMAADKHPDDMEDQEVGNYRYDAIGNLVRDNQEGMDIQWTVYGKVDRITKGDGSSTRFLYDASGNRVKKMISDAFGNTNTHYYVRDAGGNTMAVYKEESTGGASTLELREIPIYGSERLGIYTPEGAFTNNQGLVATVAAPTSVSSYQGVSYEMEDGTSLTLQPGFSFEEGVDGEGFSVSGATTASSSGPEDVVTQATDQRQYELKDHLGNVRAVVTDRKQGRTNGSSFEDLRPTMVSAAAYYPYGMDMPTVRWEPETVTATMEPSHVLEEVNAFNNYTTVTHQNDVVLNHTPEPDARYTFKLTGVDGSIIGLAKSLRVQAGDRVSTEVFGKYVIPDAGAQPTNVAALLGSAFLSAFGLPGTQEGAAISEFLDDLLVDGVTFSQQGDSDNDVLAGLNWLLFDDDFVFRDGGYHLLTSGAAAESLAQLASVSHQRLSLDGYTISQDGYFFVYTSNESPQLTEVFFDDFTVVHEKLIPDEAYDPGLVAYRYGFNGKEKDQMGEWGLNHYDYGFRIYNPALGRFLSVDPLAASYPELTPYQFASNTPIQAIDLDGLEAMRHESDGHGGFILIATQDVTNRIQVWKPLKAHKPLISKKNRTTIRPGSLRHPGVDQNSMLIAENPAIKGIALGVPIGLAATVAAETYVGKTFLVNSGLNLLGQLGTNNLDVRKVDFADVTISGLTSLIPGGKMANKLGIKNLPAILADASLSAAIDIKISGTVTVFDEKKKSEVVIDFASGVTLGVIGDFTESILKGFSQESFDQFLRRISDDNLRAILKGAGKELTRTFLQNTLKTVESIIGGKATGKVKDETINKK